MAREVFGKKDLFTPTSEEEVKTPKRQNAKTLKRLSIKTTKLPKVKTSKRRNAKISKPQIIKTTKLFRKTIYFTEELWEWIRKESYEKEKDYSEVVREAVKGLLESQLEKE